jgi:hypothetical protein
MVERAHLLMACRFSSMSLKLSLTDENGFIDLRLGRDSEAR